MSLRTSYSSLGSPSLRSVAVYGLLTVVLVLPVSTVAQAPASIAGKAFGAAISGGTSPPFADYGYFIVLPANSGNSYQLVGIYGVENSSGTYTWSASGMTGTGVFTDSGVGPVNGNFAFLTSSSGDFLLSVGPYYQEGEFELFPVAAPISIVGAAFLVTIDDGLNPYADSGTYTFRATSASTYTITGDGGNVLNSTGNYVYTRANASTGRIQQTDSVTGAGTTYFAFSSTNAGGYAITQPSTGGFQIGRFVVLDTTKPTVSITNPPSARTYTNAQTVAISATAADNIGVVRVDFYEGSTYRSTDTTPPYSHDWSFDSSNNGAHVWTARAYDAAGNATTSSPVTLTVSIDITPPTVAITSPANGANVTTASRTVTGTASDSGSPSSGLAVVEVRVNGGNWQTASGTASWSRSVTLVPCANSIEARSQDRAGNYSLLASNFVTYTPPNTPPNIPANVSPSNGATGLSLTPVLEAGPFSDADCAGDVHASSQWQVLNSAGTVVVWDSGEVTSNKTTTVVPAGRLRYASNYVWKVRYKDSRGAWSTAYSPATGFTTIAPNLSGVQQGTNLVFRWPTNALGFTLQWNTNLASANWFSATPPPAIVSGQYVVTNSMTNVFRFYRLKR